LLADEPAEVADRDPVAAPQEDEVAHEIVAAVGGRVVELVNDGRRVGSQAGVAQHVREEVDPVLHLHLRVCLEEGEIVHRREDGLRNAVEGLLGGWPVAHPRDLGEPLPIEGHHVLPDAADAREAGGKRHVSVQPVS
jgi:hypothetical protein